MNYQKWKEHHFSSGSYPGDDYLKFEKQLRNDLKKQLQCEECELVKFNKGHYSFFAIVKKYGRYAYVSIFDVRSNRDWFSKTLYRNMKDPNDYSGKGSRNMYCSWDTIGQHVSKLLTPDSKDFTIEYCPFCDSEQVIFKEGITRCDGCGKPLAPCSICEDCKDPCPYGCTGDDQDQFKAVTNRDITSEEAAFLYGLL